MNKFSKYFRIFMEEDGANPGGSLAASFMPPAGITTAEPVVDDPEPEPEPTAPAVPQNVTLDPAAFAEAIKAAGLGGNQQQQQVQDRPPTPEEIAEYKRQLKYWEAKPEFFTKFNNLETQAEAFREFHDGLTTQFATMMQAYFGQQAGALQQQFSPALGFIQQHQEQQLASRFDGQYEQLAKPELKPLRDFAVQQLRNSGQQFKTEGELFKALADQMTKAIQAVNPEFKLTAGSSPAKPTNPNAIKPAPKGGQGGNGGHKTDATAGMPLAVQHLPKIRG